MSGRWPWAVEDVFGRYGDVVRIAPNELVFFTPKASHDIYSPARRGLETFTKTDFNNRGANLGGIIWEEDPVKHHEVARKLFPAFSSRSIRTFEPLMHKHMNYFVERMKQIGARQEGVNLVDWTHWVAWDTSQDISWCEETLSMQAGTFEAFAIIVPIRHGHSSFTYRKGPGCFRCPHFIQRLCDHDPGFQEVSAAEPYQVPFRARKKVELACRDGKQYAQECTAPY